MKAFIILCIFTMFDFRAIVADISAVEAKCPGDEFDTDKKQSRRETSIFCYFDFLGPAEIFGITTHLYIDIILK